MKLNKFLLILALGLFTISVNSVSAQSKSSLKKNTKKEAEAKADNSEEENEEAEEKKIWTYVIMDLSGEDGNYGASMMVPKATDLNSMSEESILVQKKAAATSREEKYLTETDFLLKMAELELELVTVTNESLKGKAVKRFYFKREVKQK